MDYSKEDDIKCVLYLIFQLQNPGLQKRDPQEYARKQNEYVQRNFREYYDSKDGREKVKQKLRRLEAEIREKKKGIMDKFAENLI